MYVLNLNHSPEKGEILGVGRSCLTGRRPRRRPARASANCPPGVSASIELYDGMQVTRRATIRLLGNGRKGP